MELKQIKWVWNPDILFFKFGLKRSAPFLFVIELKIEII